MQSWDEWVYLVTRATHIFLRNIVATVYLREPCQRIVKARGCVGRVAAGISEPEAGITLRLLRSDSLQQRHALQTMHPTILKETSNQGKMLPHASNAVLPHTLTMTSSRSEASSTEICVRAHVGLLFTEESPSTLALQLLAHSQHDAAKRGIHTTARKIP